MSQRSELEDAYERGGIEAVREAMGEKPPGSTRITARVVRYETCTWILEGVWTQDAAVEHIQENGLDPEDSDIHSEDFDVTAYETHRH
jgi:hypothetical protein